MKKVADVVVRLREATRLYSMVKKGLRPPEARYQPGALRNRLLLSTVPVLVLVLGWPWLVSPPPQANAQTLWLVLVSGLLQICLWLGVVAVTGRPYCSLGAMALGIASLVLVNALNYQYTGSPIVPVDIWAVLGVLWDFGLFRLYLAEHAIAALTLAGVVFVLAFSIVRERPVLRWTWKSAVIRSAVLTGVIWLFVPLTTGTSAAYRLLARSGASFNAHEIYNSVGRNGLFAHLLIGLPQMTVQLPEDAGDPAVFERAMARMPRTSEARSVQRPHIVVILEESFFDPRTLAITIDPPPLARFDAVASRARYHGSLDVPVVGGGTVDSEFSLLTGLSTRWFGQAGKWPFQTLVTDPTWSIARYLDSLGYDTVGIYATPGSLFGGQEAYRKLGFGQFLDVSAFTSSSDFIGPYIRDEAVSRKVVEIISHATRPTFIFAETMENHGPWGSPGRPRSSSRIDGHVSEESRAMLADYLDRLADVETLVERTDAELRSLGVPIVFAVFGDHLPAMFSLYREAGFKHWSGTTDRSESSPSWFRTPYLVSVYPDDGPSQVQSLDVSLLASLVLDTAGVNQDPFFMRSSAYRTLCDGRLDCAPHDDLMGSYRQTVYNGLRQERAVAARQSRPLVGGGGAYEFGTPIIPGSERLGEGWAPEPWGAWTQAREATVTLTLKGRVTMPLAIVADLRPSSAAIREADVVVNGHTVSVWRLDAAAGSVARTAFVPVAAMENPRIMTLTFRTARAPSPRQVNGSPDDRPLGLAFSSLVVCVPGVRGCPTAPGQGAASP